ncbi:MAG: DUF1016 N-terminal domain-containing protein [Thomasclavelia ramosa]
MVEDELKSQRGEYGKKQLLTLSKTLTNKFGKGFSRANLQNMRLLYLKYPNCQTLSSKLSWSHYCELLYIYLMMTNVVSMKKKQLMQIGQ